MPFPIALIQGGSPAPPPGGGGSSLFLLLAMMFAIMYFMIIRPQRRKEKARTEMLSKIHKNDHVLTSGGIYGVVMNLKDEEVILRIDEANNVKVRISRGSIVSIVGPKEEKEKE